MEPRTAGRTVSQGWGFFLFAVIMIAAPLLFGAADRMVQAGLLVLFAAGLFATPPAVARLARPVIFLVIGAAILLMAREFLPWMLFGETEWRRLLVSSFEIRFPWTHNPEPVRVFESLLSMGMGVLWFLWVRSLATGPSGARNVAWALLVSGLAVAVVSLVMGQSEGTAIYGIRETAGYRGFGPFPNRNHTATFLAMSALVGCGCVFRDARHHHWLRTTTALGFIGMILVALFESRSRGGLMAGLAGGAVFASLQIWRSPRRKMGIVLAAGALVALSLFMAFGGGVMERFTSAHEGSIPTNVRWGIWSDTLKMWRDAPVFGHGLETFKQLFPMYQTIQLQNQIILHPESSWLEWLVELGILLLGAVAIGGAVFLIQQLKLARASEHAFCLRAGGLAAAAVLLCHSIWDVPAHRWGTAAFGIAALALACPVPVGARLLGRRFLLLPLGIAALWAVPLFTGSPQWSSAALARAMAKNFTTEQVSVDTLKRFVVFFPLDADLHHAIGVRQLQEGGDIGEVWRHFRIADRLKPGSWLLPAAQAIASRRFSQGMSLHFWSVAIERAGHRSEELLFLAWERTAKLPVAASFWSRYVETHPRLLLSYARLAAPDAAPGYFRLWWKERSASSDLESFEIENFYLNVSQWGSKEDLREWMKLHPERAERDFLRWAKLLHNWEADAEAWKLLSHHVDDPPFPASLPKRDVETMEAEWRTDPDDFVHAQLLAAALHNSGDGAMRDRVIILTAERSGAPEWFLRKAAFVHAGAGDYRAAVANLLRLQ